MVSGPITSWQIEGEKAEKMTDFIFLGSKITAENDCSHEIKKKKKKLAPCKKSYDKPTKHIKKQDITLPTKVHIVKALVFPVVMYVRIGPSRRLSAEELMLLNCSVGEDP